MAKCPRNPRLDATDRSTSGRHHGRERLCRTGCQRRPVRADAGDREARDVAFDIAAPDAIPPLDKAVLQVSLLSDPSVQASAALRDITPQADPQTRTWRVRATLQNPPEAMALGASVTVTLPSAAPHGYALPASALTRAGDKPAVFVITPQSRAQLRVVVPVGYTATSVMIASGLEPGDRVITAGVSTLRSGEPVMAGEVQP